MQYWLNWSDSIQKIFSAFKNNKLQIFYISQKWDYEWIENIFISDSNIFVYAICIGKNII